MGVKYDAVLGKLKEDCSIARSYKKLTTNDLTLSLDNMVAELNMDEIVFWPTKAGQNFGSSAPVYMYPYHVSDYYGFCLGHSGIGCFFGCQSKHNTTGEPYPYTSMPLLKASYVENLGPVSNRAMGFWLELAKDPEGIIQTAITGNGNIPYTLAEYLERFNLMMTTTEICWYLGQLAANGLIKSSKIIVPITDRFEYRYPYDESIAYFGLFEREESGSYQYIETIGCYTDGNSLRSVIYSLSVSDYKPELVFCQKHGYFGDIINIEINNLSDYNKNVESSLIVRHSRTSYIRLCSNEANFLTIGGNLPGVEICKMYYLPITGQHNFTIHMRPIVREGEKTILLSMEELPEKSNSLVNVKSEGIDILDTDTVTNYYRSN